MVRMVTLVRYTYLINLGPDPNMVKNFESGYLFQGKMWRTITGTAPYFTFYSCPRLCVLLDVFELIMFLVSSTTTKLWTTPGVVFSVTRRATTRLVNSSTLLFLWWVKLGQFLPLFPSVFRIRIQLNSDPDLEVRPLNPDPDPSNFLTLWVWR